MKIHRVAIALLAATSFLSGCSIKIKEEDPTTAAPISIKYDQGDLLSWADMISQDILSHPFPSAGENQPILVVMGIQNRTETHADMKAISDTITTRLLNTGKIRLVNAERRDDLLKEQGYQLANCTEETKVRIGRQLGAKYMLTGSLVQIGHESGKEITLRRKEDAYYQLTVEVTDLESGLIVLRKQRDRLRRATKPVLGW